MYPIKCILSVVLLRENSIFIGHSEVLLLNDMQLNVECFKAEFFLFQPTHNKLLKYHLLCISNHFLKRKIKTDLFNTDSIYWCNTKTGLKKISANAISVPCLIIKRMNWFFPVFRQKIWIKFQLDIIWNSQYIKAQSEI